MKEKKNLGASMVEGFSRKIKKLNFNVQRLILIIHGGGVAAAAFISISGEDHKKISIFFPILHILARTVGPMDKV